MKDCGVYLLLLLVLGFIVGLNWSWGMQKIMCAVPSLTVTCGSVR